MERVSSIPQRLHWQHLRVERTHRPVNGSEWWPRKRKFIPTPKTEGAFRLFGVFFIRRIVLKCDPFAATGLSIEEHCELRLNIVIAYEA